MRVISFQARIVKKNFNDSELIREVDVSKINQYVRILVEESRVCKLKGSEYAIMVDFDFSQGKIFA